MDTKAAFETEFRKQHPESNSMDILLEWYNHDTEEEPDWGYYSLAARDAFKWWKLSREAIEIEHKPYCVWPDEEYSDSYINGWNDHADELTSHGIRIKGKTE